LRYNTPGWAGVRDGVNTNYHKSINKALISENYFDNFFKGLLLCDSRPEHLGFAIGTLKGFGKCVANTWNIWPVINRVIHSTAAVMRNRIWQSEPGCGPTDCDRYDYHKVTPCACGSRRLSL
jgi:hypothetical protein